MSDMIKSETHLYLVRHGETEYNRRRIVQGRGVDVPLNELGHRQARALADRSIQFDLDVIYASTLIRARETAQTVADANGDTPLVYLRDLEEMSWGTYEGLEVSGKMREEFDNMRDQWRAGNYEFSIGQGESALDVQKRGVAAINHIVSRNAGKKIMVVAHGRFLRIVIASILKEYGLQRMEEIKHANTGVNYLTHTDDGFLMRYLNNTDHLVSLN